MDRVDASAVVYAAPDDVYRFLLDVPRYARYSPYLRSVERDGDGGPGTRYALAVAWRRLAYTVRARIEAVDPPSRIDWRLVGDLDARGHWAVDPAPAEAQGPDDPACTVRLSVRIGSDARDVTGLGLPRFVPLDRVLARLEPTVEAEATRVVRRAVTDLEGTDRPVELRVETDAGTR